MQEYILYISNPSRLPQPYIARNFRLMRSYRELEHHSLIIFLAEQPPTLPPTYLANASTLAVIIYWPFFLRVPETTSSILRIKQALSIAVFSVCVFTQ